MKELEYLSYKERLRVLSSAWIGLFSLDRRLSRDCISVGSMWWEGIKKIELGGGLLGGDQWIGKRQWALIAIHEISFKWKKNLFQIRVANQWNLLPREAVESPYLEILKTWLDTVLSKLLQHILLWAFGFYLCAFGTLLRVVLTSLGPNHLFHKQGVWQFFWGEKNSGR